MRGDQEQPYSAESPLLVGPPPSGETAVLIDPSAFSGETTLPAMDVRSSSRNANPPPLIGMRTEGVTATEAPHAKLTSSLLRMVIRMDVGERWSSQAINAHEQA